MRPRPNSAHNPFSPRSYGSLEQVTDRCYIFRNIVNSHIFVGDKGIAVIDTQVNHGLARRLRATLEATFAKPILYAINTHYHWDHTNGNAVFKEAGAELVGNRVTADYMRSKAPRQKKFLASRGFELGPDPLLHDIFMEDCPTLDLGGLKLELQRGHAAETDDPTLIYCPQENTLVGGDTVMTGSFPIFGQPVQQEGLENDNWLTALEQIRSFGADHVLPGHGPVAHSTELKLLEDICRYFLDQTRAQHQAGHDIHTTIANIESNLPQWISSIPVVWGTPRYAILRVWAGLEALSEDGWHHLKPTAIPSSDKAAHTTAKILDNTQQAQTWIDAAAQCVEGGDIGQCISLLRLANDELPNNHVLWNALGERLIEASRGIDSVLEKGDAFFEARSCWAKSLRIRPQFAPALLADASFLCMMAFRNGDTHEIGLTRMEEAEAAGADPAAVAFYRGIAARSTGDESSALRLFQEALSHNPGFMQARLAMMP